jgi:hypothetical protein
MTYRFLLIWTVVGWIPALSAQCTAKQEQTCREACSTFTGANYTLCNKSCETHCNDTVQPPPALVTISDGTEITVDDIAKFDTQWMQPAYQANQVNGALCVLFFRFGAGAWGVGERMRALARMYDLTHEIKYLDYLHDFAEVALRYRDDNYDPGIAPYQPGTDGYTCQAQTAPFPKQPIDDFRGKNEPGWSGRLYDDVGYSTMGEDASNLYAYPIAAFARIVAEDPSLQAKYGHDAVRYANAALQTVWALEPQLVVRAKGNNFEAYLAQLDIYRTKPSASDCQNFANQEKNLMNTINTQAKAVGKSPPYDDSSFKRVDQQNSNCQHLQCVAGSSLAHNENSLYAMTLMELWRVLDSPYYQQSGQQASNADLSRSLFPVLVSRFQRYFVDGLQPQADPNGERYYWHYQDDQPSCVGLQSEDTGHGSFDLMYLDVLRANIDRLNPHTSNEPIPFDSSQVRRFANTFLEKISTGQNLNRDIDGNAANPASSDNELCEGWVSLASADPNAYRQCREITLQVVNHASQPYLLIGNHSALLMNKHFSRQVSHLDLTIASGAPQAAGDPFGFVFAAEGVQNIVFRATDGHAHELWRTASGIGHNDLTLLAHAPSVVGDPRAYVYGNAGMQNAIYRGTDGHLHGLYWSSGAVGHDDLTALSHAPGPAGDPFAYITPNPDIQDVVYRGTDGHLHGLYWSTGSVGHDDLTALSRAPAPAGEPTAYVDTKIGYQNVVYRGIDGHLHGLYWSTGAVGHDDLTVEALAPLPIGNPAAYFLPTDGTQHVVYRSYDGHLHELSWTTGAVSRTDLTALASAPIAAGDPSAYFVAAEDCSQHVIYRSSDGHLHELRWAVASVRPTICEASRTPPIHTVH